MTALFPLTLPWPTVGYVALYLVTLLLHAIFMSYVLAGVLTVALAKVRAVVRGAPTGPISAVLVDWLPFSLSAAITAGVAPLLFVQILYQEAFYTANLLAFHRWMAILPVLIVAFYLLYVLKAKAGAPRLSAGVSILIAAAVLFVGWSWVENHLLSLDRAAWTEQYASGAMAYRDPAVFARLGFWILAAVPTFAHVVARQVRAGSHEASRLSRDVALLARAAIVALVGAASLASPVLLGQWTLFRPATAEVSGATQTWLAVAAGGVALQLLAWSGPARGGSLSRGAAWSGAIGIGAFWWGILAAREAVRAATLVTPDVLARHAGVATTSGLVVFLVFAVLAGLAIGWIASAVRRGMRESARAERAD